MKTFLFIFLALINSLIFAGETSKKRSPQSLEEEISAEIVDKSNCKIIINSQRFSGIEESQIIHSTVKNKSECDERAKVHSYNLYPNEIKSRNVEVIFEEKN